MADDEQITTPTATPKEKKIKKKNKKKKSRKSLANDSAEASSRKEGGEEESSPQEIPTKDESEKEESKDVDVEVEVNTEKKDNKIKKSKKKKSKKDKNDGNNAPPVTTAVDSEDSPKKEAMDVVESSEDAPSSPSDEISTKEEAQTETTESKDTPKDPKAEETPENDDAIITTASFASLGVCEPLCKATTSLDWAFATKIQREALPHALKGKDIIGLAETGSGKTGAFAIPILQSLLETNGGGRRSIYAICLAPTRELAFQINEVFQALGQSIGATSVCVVGGVDMASQAIALARLPHIVIATPGRLVDHLQNTKGFTLRNVKYLVLDEADRMLSLDFEEEINAILQVLPDSSTGRKTMLFSATMTSKVEKLQRASLVDPVRIEVSTKFQTPEKLLQYYLFVPAKYKDCYLTYLINEYAGQSILVFGATCNNVQRLALMLRNLGFPAICLHGQMSQPKRLNALHKFKSGGRDILICTDVASRGLDIPSVDLVINFDLPGHGKDYIHRVGRTARAGKSGMAIAMVTQYDVEVYQRLEGLLGRKLPECKLEEGVVLMLLERVCEAQRLATRELKEQLASLGRGGKSGRKRKDYRDDGMEGGVREEIKKGYLGGSSGRGGGLQNQRGSGSNGKKYRK